MSQILAGVLMLSVIVGMLVVSLIIHTHYFVRVADHVKKTSLNRTFQIKELMDSLFILQGSNFNTIMILSWNLFLVATAFLFFMTPEVLGTWSYFEVHAASDSFGLAYFGIAMIIVPGILVGALVPRAYGYYRIPKNLKQLTVLTPIFLLASVSSSIFLGTIYPETNQPFLLIGYGTLLVSLALMLAPIANGYIEEMRTRH